MAGPAQFPKELLPFPVITIQGERDGFAPISLTVVDESCRFLPNVMIVAYPQNQNKLLEQGFTDYQGQIKLFGVKNGDNIRAATLNGGLGGNFMLTNDTAYQLTLRPPHNRQTIPPPYLTLIPTTDGQGAIIYLDQATTNTSFTAEIMPHDSTQTVQSAPLVFGSDSSYTATFSNLAVGSGMSQVTSNQGVLLNANYNYQPVWANQENVLYSQDGNMAAYLPPASTVYYAIIADTGYIPPAPLTSGLTVIGSAYSVRLSGGIITLDKNALLKLHYPSDTTNNYTDISVYYWNPNQGGLWEKISSTFNQEDNSWAISTTRLGIYALLGQLKPQPRLTTIGGSTICPTPTPTPTSTNTPTNTPTVPTPTNTPTVPTPTNTPTVPTPTNTPTPTRTNTPTITPTVPTPTPTDTPTVTDIPTPTPMPQIYLPTH